MIVKHETHHNLPAKPGSAPASTSQQNAASLSYSAQIAQQFSAYQQTPSQERQQRPDPSRTQSTSAIPTHASGTPTYNISSSEDTVFGKKPSEMHDAGYHYHVYWSYTPDTNTRIHLLIWSPTRHTLLLYLAFALCCLCSSPTVHTHSKMFIGGLNWDTTDGTRALTLTSRSKELLLRIWQGIVSAFNLFCLPHLRKVDACTIMRDPSGTSRGFAFMTFEDPASVALVLGREHILDGKAIDPKRAIPREEHLRNTRYFVGGLSPATTSESMKQFFSACKYGKVVDATVMVDRESSRSKGFGFVTFEDATNADQLVGKLGLTIDDKEIEVKMAQPRSQRDQGRMANGQHVVRQSSDGDDAPDAGSHDGRDGGWNGHGDGQRRHGRGMANGGMASGGMGTGMPMMGMNMNPMAMMGMGMGMNGFNPMAGMGGMNMMGGMNGMMNGMNGMGNMGMGGMRMGMGPIGGTGTGMGVGAMGMTGMRGGMAGMNPNFGRMVMNAGAAGPARTNNRGQHNFHPYSR
ncbi:HnRNP A1-gamma isoform [Mycena venus]|uniref:HnRNP A1-gamma isoform n=1 Tax=Mycena venus TaxID=2733690 RepID=A0A8H7CAR6_9AGAR|nr:HnRNP A1-gamma isoform [Mycena venus]